MIDHVRLSRDQRFAVILRNFGGGSARIAAVSFRPINLLKEQAGSPFQGPFNSPTYPSMDHIFSSSPGRHDGPESSP